MLVVECWVHHSLSIMILNPMPWSLPLHALLRVKLSHQNLFKIAPGLGEVVVNTVSMSEYRTHYS